LELFQEGKEGGIKENGEFKYDIFYIRTYIDATMYPHPT
jgi:hypothetical protein